MLLNKRFKIFLNYVAGPLLFGWLAYSIYGQVKQQGNIEEAWQQIKEALYGPQNWKLALVVLLMLATWFIEALKWQALVKPVQKISLKHAIRDVYAGQALSVSSINGLGDMAGKSIYLDEGNRLRGMAQSMVGSWAQFLVNVSMGLFSLIYFRIVMAHATQLPDGLSIWQLNLLILLIAVPIFVLSLLYFRLAKLVIWLNSISWMKRYRFLVEKLSLLDTPILTKILFFSAARYVVSLVQYMLLLQVLGVGMALPLALAVTGTFLLAITAIPTIALAELGIRGQLSLYLFGFFSANTLGIIATVTGIWLINQIAPAVIGGIGLLSIRLFRNTKQ